MGIKNTAIYLTQFTAILLIIGGGTAIVSSIVEGTHSVAGWCAVIIGFLVLIIGAKPIPLVDINLNEWRKSL